MNSLEAAQLPTANHALGVSVRLMQQAYRNFSLDLLNLRIAEAEIYLTALQSQQSHLKTGHEWLKLQALQNKVNAATPETPPPSPFGYRKADPNQRSPHVRSDPDRFA